MNDPLYDLIFFDELPQEARRELAAALERDAALRRAFRKWRRIQQCLREQLDARVPDRHLLVLYALRTTDDELLTSAEAARVEGARGELEEALQAHPGLQDVVRRIREDKHSFEAVWEQHTAGSADERPRLRLVRQLSSPWAVRAAAVVAVLALTSLVYFGLADLDGTVETVETGIDEQQQIELADGSSVRLGEQSRLTYNASASRESARGARLEGTALFQVASGRRPFVVETATANAKVVGTTFGLSSRSTETEIAVADGRVAFSPLTDSMAAVVVSSGQASRIGRDGSPSEPTAVDLTQALGWTGYLFFRNTAVRDVVERLARQYEQPVTVAAPLASETVTGTFHRDQPLDEILGVIATTLDARLETAAEGGYRLKEGTNRIE